MPDAPRAEKPTEPAPPPAEPAAPAEGSPAEAAPEREEWETRFKYLLADFENFRKRTARERREAEDRTRAVLLKGLLPLYESVDRARASVAGLPEGHPVRRGLDLLGREWQGFLDREGVHPLAQPGRRFLPEEHEAVGEAPVSAKFAEGTIVEIVQQGYGFDGGIIRPAKVIVARRPAPAAAEAEAAPAPARSEE